MNKTVLAILSVLLPILAAAQTPEATETELVDSVIYTAVASVDETLSGKSVYVTMPENVTVNEQAEVGNAMRRQISNNASRQQDGYRVRIYFDNKQISREESETEMLRFQKAFPGIATYRSFKNPYFKVTVGDYRTKADAHAMLLRIQGKFPAAFVVKESINYPVIDIDNAVKADTVQITRTIIAE